MECIVNQAVRALTIAKAKRRNSYCESEAQKTLSSFRACRVLSSRPRFTTNIYCFLCCRPAVFETNKTIETESSSHLRPGIVSTGLPTRSTTDRPNIISTNLGEKREKIQTIAKKIQPLKER